MSDGAAPARRLVAVKLLHTIAWAFFAGCIVALPWAAWRGEMRLSAWLAAIVMVEVIILALNRFACPLTAVAARYTDERRANFDIYLPEWLARYNKARDLIQLGAYVPGHDAELDQAVRLHPALSALLQQDMHEPAALQDSFDRLCELVAS